MRSYFPTVSILLSKAVQFPIKFYDNIAGFLENISGQIWKMADGKGLTSPEYEKQSLFRAIFKVMLLSIFFRQLSESILPAKPGIERANKNW